MLQTRVPAHPSLKYCRETAKLKKVLRRMESTFVVTPFVIYSFLGLGVPALAVIYLRSTARPADGPL